MAFMVTSPRSKTPALLMPRRCKYCKGNFIPERPQDKDAKFCTPNHRKAFWRYGGLPFDKMKEQIMKDVRKMVRTEIAEALTPSELGPQIIGARAALTAFNATFPRK